MQIQLTRVRRTLAATVGAATLALSLTSCGFSNATDRQYTPASGVNDHAGTVDVLNAVIVSAEPDSGTFLASFSNADRSTAVSFVALDFGEGAPMTAAEFGPVEIPPAQLVNLADGDQGVRVSGQFEAGQFVDVDVVLDNGETASMEIPVVPATNQWEGLDNATQAPVVSETPSEDSSEDSSEEPAAE